MSACCGRVFDRNLPTFHRYRQCVREATVERDGKHYCKQHDPELVRARRDASYAKFTEKYEAERKQRQLEQAAQDLLAALEAIIAGMDRSPCTCQPPYYGPGKRTDPTCHRCNIDVSNEDLAAARAAIARARGEKGQDR